MVLVLGLGVLLYGIIKIVINFYNMRTYVESFDDYAGAINALATTCPTGVDKTLWARAVFDIGKEPFAHPLREGDQEGGSTSCPAAEADSLRRISSYIENAPIEIETLPALREMILRNYDANRQLTGPPGFPKDHAQSCTKEFSVLMDSIRKSRQ